MSLAAAAPTSAMPGPLQRFTVLEYHQLIDAGLFQGDERVELLEGWIVAQIKRKPPHDAVIDRVAELLRDLLPPDLRIRIQSAITTSESEPEPDIAVVRGKALDDVHRHPGPSDIALVIEVADSSVERDRAKARVYARAGIPTYWIVSLAERWVEVYEAPSGDVGSPCYHRRQDYAPGSDVPLLVDGAALGAVAGADMLPQ